MLRFMAVNTQVVTNANGGMTFKKPDGKNPFKIDGIVAGTMGTGRLGVRVKGYSRYEDEDVDDLVVTV